MNDNKFFPSIVKREIPYDRITLGEAIYILTHNKGRMNRFDADKQAVVIEI